MKFYHIALILLGSLFFSTASASSENLPYCQESYCEKVFHNKKLEKATLIVWTGNGDIIQTYTFNLEKSAKRSSENNLVEVAKNQYRTSSDAPPAPCQTGSCSITSTPTTYVTTTEIVTVSVTFVYHNGELVNVKITETRTKKPDDERIEK